MLTVREEADTQETSDRAAAKPKVFIGSSQEGRDVAACIQQEIIDEVDATGWWQNVFGLSAATLESLEQEAGRFDFAVLVVTPDDPGQKRGRPCLLPRDNVMFELGLFMGALGRSRTFVVRERVESLEMPSDFAGVTVANFCRRKDNLRAALGPACTDLKTAMRKIWGDAPNRPLSADPMEKARQVIARRRRRRSLGTAQTRGPQEIHRIVDLSVSGALLETRHEVSVGTVLDLDLDLENGSSAHVMAKVVRIQQPAWGRVGGVGVAFQDVKPRSKRFIEEYVNSDPSAWNRSPADLARESGVDPVRLGASTDSESSPVDASPARRRRSGGSAR